MDCKKEVENLVKFIQTEVTAAGKVGCIVGVSGGVDSGCVIALCKLAFPNTTLGVQMPTTDKVNRDSTKRSAELCEKLGIEYVLSSIPANTPSIIMTSKAVGNWMARQRMATLYAFSEMNDSLVIGTENLSENFIGYFTKWGDSGSDLECLAEYFKSEVYELAAYLGVPTSILNCEASAELWEGQTDELEMGYTYDNLEEYIRTGMILVKDGQEIGKKIQRQHEATEFKRNPIKCYERS